MLELELKSFRCIDRFFSVDVWVFVANFAYNVFRYVGFYYKLYCYMYNNFSCVCYYCCGKSVKYRLMEFLVFDSNSLLDLLSVGDYFSFLLLLIKCIVFSYVSFVTNFVICIIF